MVLQRVRRNLVLRDLTNNGEQLGKYQDPEYNKKYYRLHRERWDKHGVYHALRKIPRGVDKEWETVQKRLYRHNITIDQLHSMYESQDFLCAICHEEKKLDIDHNHTTGKFRGLLCNQCNQSLGLMKDNPERLRLAAEYLEKNKHANPTI